MKSQIDISEAATPWEHGWVSCLNCINVIREGKLIHGCVLFPDMTVVSEKRDSPYIFKSPPIVGTCCGQGVFVIRGNPPRLLNYQQWYQEFVLPEYEREVSNDKKD